MKDPVETKWIALDPASPGFDGYLALPPARKGPGILLFQELSGVNQHIQTVIRQYALDGFVVLAMDVYWRQKQKVDLGYDGEERQQALMHTRAVKPAETEADILRTAAVLRARPETAGYGIGAIGYCMGGNLAYLSASLGVVDAAVPYYGGEIHNMLGRAATITCPMQFHFAETDHNIPLPAVEKVRTALGARAEVFIHPGASHGFNSPQRPGYHARSAALAHGLALAFLATRLYRG